MRLRKFQAANAAEALREVKRELGAEALILRTRERPGGGVEVTAATDVDRVVDPLTDPPPGRGAARVPEVERLDDVQALLATFGSQLRRLERQLPAAVAPVAEAERGLQGEALELARALRQHGVPEELAVHVGDRFGVRRSDGETFDDAVAHAITDWLPAAHEASTPSVRFLIGPTGCGKTTTLAKLAAERVLAGGPRPLLLNADTMRLGAGEQLACVGRLLDVEVEDVRSPQELNERIASVEPERSVLVDTAGLSSDTSIVRGVHQLVEGVGRGASVTAVVSATAARSALQRAWTQMDRFKPDSSAITHVDESDEPGIACSWLGEMGVPLQWLGTGQRVPEDLASATGANLALWLVAA